MLQTNSDSLKINSTTKNDINYSNNIENISDISNNNIEDEKNKISSTSPIYIFCHSLKEMNSQNETGWTPIYRSVLANNIPALKELLDLGGDPNICNSLGETPLYLSVENQNYEALKILLEHNADPNIKKRNGNTPLHIAIKKKLENKYIISLLNSKADPNILNKFYNQTPAHLALINKCDEEILKTLKENKADIYGIKDKYEKTPFDYVQESNDNDYMNKVINIFGKKEEEAKNENNTQIKIKPEKKEDKAIDLNSNKINTIKIDLNDNNINIIKGKNNKKENNEISFNYLKLNLPNQQAINNISFGNKNSYEIKDDDISIKMNNNKSKDKIEQESNKENMNININKSKPLTMDIPDNNYLLNSLNNIGILSKKNNKTESKNIISFPEYLKLENNNDNIIEKIGLVNNYINNNDFNSIASKNNKTNSNEKNVNNVLNSNINSSSLCYSLSKETQTQKIKEAESEIEIKNKMFSNSSDTDKEIIKTIISATAKRISNSKDKNLSNSLSNNGNKNSNSNNSNQTSKIININRNAEINVFTPDNFSDEILNILDEEDKNKEKEKAKNMEEKDKTSPFIINTKIKDENQNMLNNNNIENNQFKTEDNKNELNIKNVNNLNINTNEINNDNKNENKDNENLISLTKDSNIFGELQMNTTDENLNKTKEEILKDNLDNKNNDKNKDNNNENDNNNLNISKNTINKNNINIKQMNSIQSKGTLIDDKNIDLNFSISNYKENVVNPLKTKDTKLLKKDFEILEEQNQSVKENKNKNEQKNNINHLSNKIIEISNHKKVGMNKEKDNSNIYNNKNSNQTNNVHRLSYHNNYNNKRNKVESEKDNLINNKNEDEMSNMTNKTSKTNKTYKSNKTNKTANIVTEQKNNISYIYNKENENPNNVIVYQSKNFLARTTNKNKIIKNSNPNLSKNLRQKVYYGESKSIERKDKILYNKQKVFRHSSPDYNYNYQRHFNKDNLISENSYKKNNNSFISALNTNRSNESNNNIYIFDNINNNYIGKRNKYNNYTNQFPLYNPYDDSIEGSMTNNTNNIMYRNKNNLTKNKFAFNMNSFNNTTYSSYHNNICKIRNKNYLEPLMNRNSVTNNSFSNNSNSNCYSYRNNSGHSSYRNSNNQNILISDRNNNIYITKNNNNGYRLSLKPHRTISNHILIRLRDWLISCDLLCYYNILIKNNMYNIDRYIDDIRNNKINLSYRDIEELGIRKPGHIFRLLLKLEVDAGKIDNNIYNYIIEKFNINTVTNNGILTSSISDIKCCGLNCCSTNNNYNYGNRRINNNSNIFSDNYYSNNYDDNGINTNETENDFCEDITYVDIFSFLKKKNLWRFKENFIHNGFDQIEYVLIQLFSKYSFDKNILNDYMHIYIDDEKNYVLKKLYSEKKKISKILGLQYNDEELKQILLSQSSSADNYNNYMSSMVGTNSNIHNNDSCCSIF